MPLLSDYLFEPGLVLGFRAEHSTLGFGTVVRIEPSESEEESEHERIFVQFDNDEIGKTRDFAVDIFLNRWGQWFRNVDAIADLDRYLQPLLARLRRNTISPVRDHAYTLSSEDFRLCFAWAGHSNFAAIGEDSASLERAIGSYQAGRLISARLAELAAIDYYKALGHTVEDISITQLHANPSNQQWKDFDLLVDGRAVDVKNARKSFNSPNSYVEHCVPRFKVDRKSNADVAILGVLSSYQTLEQFALGDVVERIILGEVSVDTIRKLYVWVKKRFGDIIDFSGLWKPEYQPGWVFEFRPEFYGDRMQVLAELGDLLSSGSRNIPNFHIPGCLLALSPLKVVVSSCLHEEAIPARVKREHEILDDLLDIRETIGYSRSAAYVYAMAYIMEAIAKAKADHDTIPALRRMLFTGNTSKKVAFRPRPFGLADPLGYVSSLLDAFESILKAIQDEGIKFSAFKLTHPSIIKARTNSDKWITILAYCGGWQESPIRVKCGNTPLHLGKNVNCSECGHLVCNNCGFCAADCVLCDVRQREVAEGARSMSITKGPDFDDCPF